MTAPNQPGESVLESSFEAGACDHAPRHCGRLDESVDEEWDAGEEMGMDLIFEIIQGHTYRSL